MHARLCLAILIGLLFSSATVSLPAQTFFEQLPGPEGGLVYAVACNSSGDPVCITQTRVYRWDAGASSWQNAFEFWIDVNNKKLFRASDGRLFACAVTARLLMSEDDGTTWEEVTSLTAISRDMTENASGYLFNAGNGVMMSTDHGESWIERSSGIEEEYLHAITVLQNGDMIVAAPQTGMFRSTDDGLLWNAIADSPLSVFDLLTASNGYVFAAATDGVHVSTDNGATWTKTSAAPAISSIAENPDGVLFACSMDTRYGIEQSTDNGATWTKTDAESERLIGRGIAFSADGTGYCATVAGVMKYPVATKRWQVMNSGLAAATVTAITGLSNGDLVAAVSDQGLHRSTDHGLSWTRIGEEQGMLYVEFLLQSNAALYAASTDWLHRSTDNGTTWERLNPSDRFATCEGVAVDAQGNFYAAVSGSMYYSSDDGASWEIRGEGLPSKASTAFARADDGTLYIAIYSEGVFQSTDGGQQWTELTAFPQDVNPYSLHCTENGTLYVGTAGDGVFRSTDGGANWQHLIEGLGDHYVRIIFTSPSGAVYCTSNTGVYLLNAETATWISLHGHAYRSRSLNVDIRGHLLVGTYGNGLYRSIAPLAPSPPPAPTLLAPANNAVRVGRNPAFQWELQNEAAAYRFQLSKDPSMRETVIDTVVDAYGQLVLHNLDQPEAYFWHVAGLNDAGQGDWSGAYRFNTGDVTTVQPAEAITFALGESYPHPCRNIARIPFSLAEASRVRLTLHSLLGREIVTLYSGILPAGKHQVRWNASAVSRGIYLCTLQTGSGKVAHRVIHVAR
jgi:photosystem II stability/assembly factor-like uncharacterized protein